MSDLSFEHTEEEAGGSKWPYQHKLVARHPDHGPVGFIDYKMSGSRANSKILIDRLEVYPRHQGNGYATALMDHLQERHPKSSINHGDRTDAGKGWWESYGKGKADRRGRTAGYAEYVRDAWHRRADEVDDPDRKRFVLDNAQRDFRRYQEAPHYQVGEEWPDDPHVGWVKTDQVARFREHAGQQHGESRQAVQGIREDLEAGRGWMTPLQLSYDHGTGRASLGEGNHRLRAAEEAGEEYVPVKMQPAKNYFGGMPQGAEVPEASSRPAPRGDSFHPADVLPTRWLHPDSRPRGSGRTAGKVLDLNDGHPDDDPIFDHTWNVKSYHLEGNHYRLFGQEPRVDGGKQHMLQYTLTPQKTIRFNEGHLDRIRRRNPDAEHVMKGFPVALHPDHEIHDPQFHDPHAGLPEQKKAAPPKYYHGTTVPNVTHVLPANHHGGPVVFASDTSRDHAYATTNHDHAWSYAEKAWHADDHGRRPRVYEVKPIGGQKHVEIDPRHNPDGTARYNYQNDYRSKKGWKVVREVPMPEHMGDPEDWDR